MPRLSNFFKPLPLTGNYLTGHFTLPDEAWWDDFYTPMEYHIKKLQDKYANDAEALAILDQLAAEPDIHRRYSDFYAYEFFVVRRPFSQLHHPIMEMNELDTLADAAKPRR